MLTSQKHTSQLLQTKKNAGRPQVTSSTKQWSLSQVPYLYLRIKLPVVYLIYDLILTAEVMLLSHNLHGGTEEDSEIFTPV